MSTNRDPSKFVVSSGAPTEAAARGTLGIDVTNARLYRNVDGGTTWLSIGRGAELNLGSLALGATVDNWAPPGYAGENFISVATSTGGGSTITGLDLGAWQVPGAEVILTNTGANAITLADEDGVILVVTRTPSTYATGLWPASIMNTGKFTFTFTPTQASTNATYNDWKALATASDNGGIYLTNNGSPDRSIELYNQTPTQIFQQPITWSAGLPITITLDNILNEVTIAGASTGNGTFGFAASGTYFTAANTLGVGTYPPDAFFNFNGSISNFTSPATSSLAQNRFKIVGNPSVIRGATILRYGSDLRWRGVSRWSTAD